ncbi:MAG: NUDIX domain-containing protein [Hyphomicrobium sp.]|nr:NUDIX domain-containing protein [Hyphomicrobium sp.]
MKSGRARRSELVTLGVQAAVVDDQKRVLLIRHGYRPGWHFPGGGVERGESLETALARELQEEAGVMLRARPRLWGLFAHFDVFPGDHIALYVADAWHQPHVPAPNSEIAEQRFVALDDLPAGLNRGTGRRLGELFMGEPRSEHW